MSGFLVLVTTSTILSLKKLHNFYFTFLGQGRLRKGFFVYSWLPWNFLCRPRWPWTQKSTWLCLMGAEDQTCVLLPADFCFIFFVCLLLLRGLDFAFCCFVFFYLCINLCVYVWVPKCTYYYGKVKGQNVRVGSFLPPCVFGNLTQVIRLLANAFIHWVILKFLFCFDYTFLFYVHLPTCM